ELSEGGQGALGASQDRALVLPAQEPGGGDQVLPDPHSEISEELGGRGRQGASGAEAVEDRQRRLAGRLPRREREHVPEAGPPRVPARRVEAQAPGDRPSPRQKPPPDDRVVCLKLRRGDARARGEPAESRLREVVLES